MFYSAPMGLLDILAAVDTVYELNRQEDFNRADETLKELLRKVQKSGK
jgi:hypothetical protein